MTSVPTGVEPIARVGRRQGQQPGVLGGDEAGNEVCHRGAGQAERQSDAADDQGSDSKPSQE